MAGENSIATMNGLFKETYADNVVDLLPKRLAVYGKVKFVREDQREGNIYHQPVVLTGEHGITYAGGALLGTAYNLVAATATQSLDAQVQATEMTGRTQMAYGPLYKAVTEGGDKKRAFVNASKYFIKNLAANMARRQEMMMLYGGPIATGTSLNGQSGIAALSAPATIDATHHTYVVTPGTWGPGFWAGTEKALVDAYRLDTGALINTTGGAGSLSVVAVALDTHTVQLTGNAADLTAIDTQATGANCVLYFTSASGNESLGLKGIFNTQTGNLWNIPVATYGLWKPTIADAGNLPLTFAKILQALDAPIARGLDYDVTCLTNIPSWTDLMTDLASLRRLDMSYRVEENKNGMKGIRFYGQNGIEIEVIGSPFVKQSDTVIFPQDLYVRVGSTDIAFTKPGSNDPFVVELSGQAGYEVRAFADQALFTPAPALGTWIKNITPAHQVT